MRKVKSTAFRCLQEMKIEHLFNYWNRNKKKEGLRNKRYVILLVLMIVANEEIGLAGVFMKKYKQCCQ